ncbi:hypothetical protein D9M71_218740 [compost metagenome]
MQQRRASLIAFCIRHGITDQPVQVITFELVRGPGQRQRIADAVKTGARAEDIMKGQGAEGGIAAGAAAADKGLGRVDQLAIGQVLDHRAGILDIDFTPAQVQGLAIRPAVAAAAAVVEVSHGEAALGPVLDTRVERRVARRGRAAMDEHDQGRPFGAVHGRVEETVGNAIAAGVAQ